MAYRCVLHGWYSRYNPCPACSEEEGAPNYLPLNRNSGLLKGPNLSPKRDYNGGHMVIRGHMIGIPVKTKELAERGQSAIKALGHASYYEEDKKAGVYLVFVPRGFSDVITLRMRVGI